MECHHCKNKLANVSSLNYHIKTNKKCIAIQKNITVSTIGIKCLGCEKLYSSEYILNNHIKECVAFEKTTIIEGLKNNSTTLKNKIEELEIDNEYIKSKLLTLNNQYTDDIFEKDRLLTELEAKIELYKEFSNSSKSSATTVNNNTVNNNVNNNIIVSSLDIMEDPSKLNMLIEKYYSTDYFIEGQVGVAKFSNDHLITDDDGNKLYICTDTSRNSFKYKNSKGEIVKDPHGTNLAVTLLDNGLKDMARKHLNTLLSMDHDFNNVTSKFFEIDDMCKDTKKFCKHLGSLVAI